MRREVRGLLTVLVSVGLLAAVATQVDVPGAVALVQEARLGPFLLAAALGPLQIVLSAIRWRMVTAKLGADLPLRTAGEEYALATLLNMVLPGGVGGDAIRTWRVHRRFAVPGGVAIQATLIERGAGQAVLMLITLGGLLAWPVLHPGLARPSGALPAVLVASAVVIALALWPGRFGERIRASLLSRGVLLPQLVLSGIIVASYIAGLDLCARALSVSPGGLVLTVFPLILLAQALPISMGGWGLRETAAVALLAPMGWSGEVALAVAGLYGLSALLGALPGALVLLRPAAAA